MAARRHHRQGHQRHPAPHFCNLFFRYCSPCVLGSESQSTIIGNKNPSSQVRCGGRVCEIVQGRRDQVGFHHVEVRAEDILSRYSARKNYDLYCGMDFRRFPHDTQVNFLKLGQSLTLSLTTTRLARCRSTPMAPRSGTTHSGCPVPPAMPCPTCTYVIKIVLLLSYFEPFHSQLVDGRDGEAGDLL